MSFVVFIRCAMANNKNNGRYVYERVHKFIVELDVILLTPKWKKKKKKKNHRMEIFSNNNKKKNKITFCETGVSEETKS